MSRSINTIDGQRTRERSRASTTDASPLHSYSSIASVEADLGHAPAPSPPSRATPVRPSLEGRRKRRRRRVRSLLLMVGTSRLPGAQNADPKYARLGSKVALSKARFGHAPSLGKYTGVAATSHSRQGRHNFSLATMKCIVAQTMQIARGAKSKYGKCAKCDGPVRCALRARGGAPSSV